MSEPACTQQRFVDGLGHCWHTGSGWDSASYSTTKIHSRTHLICCHCGQTKVEVKDLDIKPLPEPDKHGPHNWQEKQAAIMLAGEFRG